MSWFRSPFESRPRKARRCAVRTVEALEERALLADGIIPLAGPAIQAQAGVPIVNAMVAAFVVSDPAGLPGTQWEARVNWGDGQVDRNLHPVAGPNNTFVFLDSHIYRANGIFSITVNIAVPNSQKPNDNVVMTEADVGPPAPPVFPLTAAGTAFVERAGRGFQHTVATFFEPHTNVREFMATIDWGDQTQSNARIQSRGRSRFVASGFHRYAQAGSFQVTVTIADDNGQTAIAHTRVLVLAGRNRR